MFGFVCCFSYLLQVCSASSNPFYDIIFPKLLGNGSATIKNLPFWETTQFTICFRTKQNTNNGLPTLSYETREVNSLNLYLDRRYMILRINGQASSYGMRPIHLNQFVHICLVRDMRRETGFLTIYKDGRAVYHLDTPWFESKLKGGGSLVLSKIPEKYLKDYKNPSSYLIAPADDFEGAMTDVEIWDTVLSKDQVLQVRDRKQRGNIFSWVEAKDQWNLVKPVFITASEYAIPKPLEEVSNNYEIVFPSTGSFATAVLENVPFKKATSQFTICLRVNQTREKVTFISYSVTWEPYNIVVEVFPLKTKFWVENKYQTIKLQPILNEYIHYCYTCNCSSGDIEVYQEGKKKSFILSGNTKDTLVHENGLIALGQDQDSYGGGFDKTSSLTGTIKDVHIWDRILSAEEVSEAYMKKISGNIVNWEKVKKEWFLEDVSIRESEFDLPAV